MKRLMGKRMVFTVLALPVIAVLGYAWVDGGRQPLHQIDQSLPLPGTGK